MRQVLKVLVCAQVYVLGGCNDCYKACRHGNITLALCLACGLYAYKKEIKFKMVGKFGG